MLCCVLLTPKSINHTAPPGRRGLAGGHGGRAGEDKDLAERVNVDGERGTSKADFLAQWKQTADSRPRTYIISAIHMSGSRLLNIILTLLPSEKSTKRLSKRR